MKTILVPILTEQYKIKVCIGSKKELIRFASKYLDKTKEDIEKFVNNNRGAAFNTFDMGLNIHPLIIINGDFPAGEAIATVAHEASHAMDYLQWALGIKDGSGEFHAHGIASVIRHASKLWLKEKQDKKDCTNKKLKKKMKSKN